LSTVEVALLHDLRLVLEHVQPRRDTNDRRKWIPHGAGLFSVQSAYSSLLDLFSLEALESNTVRALKKLWITKVPSKASIFGLPKWLCLIKELLQATWRSVVCFVQMKWKTYNMFFSIAV
jgi:hypothetical protein